MSKKELFTISDTGKPQPLIVNMYDYLNNCGYCAEKNKSEFDLYKIDKQFIYPVYEPDLQKEIKDYFVGKNKPENIIIEVGKREPVEIEITAENILEAITKYGLGKIVNKNNFVHLNETKIKYHKHTKDKAFFYFKNCYVEITKDKIIKHDYSSFEGKILSTRYIDKELLYVFDEKTNIDEKQNAAPRGAKFDDFLSMLCLTPKNDPLEQIDKSQLINHEGVTYKVDKDKLKYLMQLLGYLLHNFKMRGGTDICPIFCDDEAGGSGKGLLVQAISQLSSVCEIDCKIKLSDHSPANLTKHTQVKVYQDVQKTFNLTTIYNETTEQGTIKHIYDEPINIPYEDMWKVCITSNHIIKGSHSSDLRRQKVFDLFPFFSVNNPVREKYGHSFFSNDWDSFDWTYFYNRMFCAVQLWLQCDYKIEYQDSNYMERKINESYPESLIKFINNLERDKFYFKKQLFDDFILFDKSENLGKSSKNIEKYLVDNKNYFGRLMRNYLNETEQKFYENSNRTEIIIYSKK